MSADDRCPAVSPTTGRRCTKKAGHRPAFHEADHPNGILYHKVLWHGESTVQAVPVTPLDQQEDHDGGP